MNKFGIGKSVLRKEDVRLLTGNGLYMGDINFENQLYAYVLRSPHANAKIISIDTSSATSTSGIIGVYTYSDVKEIKPLPCTVDSMFEFKKRNGSKRFFPKHNVLASKFVRHVGDPVAIIVAETLTLAKDAAELISVEYEILPCVIDPEQAVKNDSYTIYQNEGATDNIAFLFKQGRHDSIEKIFNQAEHITRFKHINQRIVCNSMEPRGCIGVYHKDNDNFELYTNTQSVYRNREVCSKQLGIKEDQLTVICPDVGGSFGMKGMPYPEQPLVLWLAKKLNRPVKWYSDRSEAFLSDTQGRDLVIEAELALNKDGKFLGIRSYAIGNMGAYASNFGPMILSLGSTKLLPGCYIIPEIYSEVEVVLTNKVFTDAYRGAGRPEASYTIERLVDKAAKELNIDPVEIRKMNLIKENQMPFTGPTGLIYDSGNFELNLQDCLTKSKIESYEKRKEKSKLRGYLRGIGISVYIEATAGGVPETSKIEINPDGTIDVYTGALAQGQAHETTFSQIVADKFGIAIDKINFFQGNSNLLPKGGGTGGSRSSYSAGGAILASTKSIIDKSRLEASNILEVKPEDLDFQEGNFTIKGTDKKISIFNIAKNFMNEKNNKDKNKRLSSFDSYTSEGSTFPNGCHIVEVEIDPETGFSKIDKYAVIDDFGVVLNPMIVEGQIHGGIAQGIGQALLEDTIYDNTGQLVTGSFMDYTMPRADNIPSIDISMNSFPCKTNSLGIKGAGEAGTTGATGAVINAIINALSPLGISHIEMPATPQRIWETINKR